MSAWAVTMGAGVTMGSCMSYLPFHAGGGRGPKSITWTPAMAKHNSRVIMAPGRKVIPSGVHPQTGDNVASPTFEGVQQSHPSRRVFLPLVHPIAPYSTFP